MKKFEFTMHKVLDLKNTVLDEEKNRLSQLQAAVRQIEGQIARLTEAMHAIAEEMMERQADGITVAELLGYNARKSNIHLQIKELKERLAEAQKKADAQMQTVIEASREVSKLEKVEERQYESYREMVKKSETAFMEELVSTNVSYRRINAAAT